VRNDRVAAATAPWNPPPMMPPLNRFDVINSEVIDSSCKHLSTTRCRWSFFNGKIENTILQACHHATFGTSVKVRILFCGFFFRGNSA
jgi:hypothetical protein